MTVGSATARDNGSDTGTIPSYAFTRKGAAQEKAALLPVGVEPRRIAYLRLDGPRVEEQVLSREELASHANRGRLTIIDVRPADEYRPGHPPGSVSIPLEELEQRIPELPADGELVAYCRGADCVMAYEALDVLRAHGLKARRLEDGMLEWRLAGLAVEHGDAA